MNKHSKYRPLMDEIEHRIGQKDLTVHRLYQLMMETLDEIEEKEKALESRCSELKGLNANLGHVASGLELELFNLYHADATRQGASSEEASEYAKKRTSDRKLYKNEKNDEQLEKIASLIHYPECWDTVTYPTLFDAINEIGIQCSACNDGSIKSDRVLLPRQLTAENATRAVRWFESMLSNCPDQLTQRDYLAAREMYKCAGISLPVLVNARADGWG